MGAGRACAAMRHALARALLALALLLPGLSAVSAQVPTVAALWPQQGSVAGGTRCARPPQRVLLANNRGGRSPGKMPPARRLLKLATGHAPLAPRLCVPRGAPRSVYIVAGRSGGATRYTSLPCVESARGRGCLLARGPFSCDHRPSLRKRCCAPLLPRSPPHQSNRSMTIIGSNFAGDQYLHSVAVNVRLFYERIIE